MATVILEVVPTGLESVRASVVTEREEFSYVDLRGICNSPR